MKGVIKKSLQIVTFLTVSNSSFSEGDDASKQMQLLNSQIQVQLQTIQASQQNQIKTLNTQLQTQLKQLQSTLEAEIQKASAQSSDQLKQVQATLQQQIKQVQQDVEKASKQ